MTASGFILEVTYASQLLDIIKDTVDEFGKSGEWSATIAILASNDGPVQLVRDVLESLKTKLHPNCTNYGSKLAKVAASMTWPFTKQEIDEVLKSIERQKTLLLMAFENHHAQLLVEIKKEVSAVHARLRDVHATVAELSDKMVAPVASLQGKCTELPYPAFVSLRDVWTD